MWRQDRKGPHHCAPPTPAKEAPLQAEEIMHCIAEVEQLKGVGRSASSSLTQQLAQMAAEAWPSISGKKEPTRPPRRNSSGWKGKEDQEVLAWHGCSLRDPAVPKEHRAPH